ncbi:MAG: ATP-binding protein [Ginsengibacter sp.]
MATKMPIISITGPRQSGKTTLAKQCFPDYDYMNLENPDVFATAKSDPRLFLSQHKKGLIIDEAQLMPELFSYLQTISDENNKPGEFILTGSQNFLMSEKISQSLAGRVFVTHLLPFSIAELKKSNQWKDNFNQFIFRGFYPRIYDKDIPAELFYPSYIQTYTERDIRQIINVGNLSSFQRFMRLVAGRTGQLLNYSSIANELGHELKTIKSWFSILESSFVIFLLQPHHKNYSKRIVKTPKLYFYDTGLACSLLGIKDQADINLHWAKGALFENMIIADIMKNYLNKAQVPALFFWRDSTGNELDCLIEEVLRLKCLEIKSSTTLNSDFFKGLNYYKDLSNSDEKDLYLIYGGDKNVRRKEATVLSWKNTVDLT